MRAVRDRGGERKQCSSQKGSERTPSCSTTSPVSPIDQKGVRAGCFRWAALCTKGQAGGGGHKIEDVGGGDGQGGGRDFPATIVPPTPRRLTLEPSRRAMRCSTWFEPPGGDFYFDGMSRRWGGGRRNLSKLKRLGEKLRWVGDLPFQCFRMRHARWCVFPRSASSPPCHCTTCPRCGVARE
jgi:hypothetical protein